VISLNSITVRTFRREDVSDIIDIIKSSRLDFVWGFFYSVYRYDEEEFWWLLAGNEDYPTYVAEFNGKVIGLVTNGPHWEEKNNYYIGLLVTHHDYRGLGAGRSLITKCLEIAVEKKYDLLSLHTWASNRAMNLYKRTGFAWIHGTNVYMINFSPQLFKSERIKEIFGKPSNLIDCLTGPAEKVNINGYVAWRYKWIKDGNEVIAVFDNDSKKLLQLIINDEKIIVNPPDKREYLKDEDVSINIEVSKPIPMYFDDKLIMLKEGQNNVTIKAKEKVELKIGEYKFGFNMKVVPEIEVKISSKMSISPLLADVIIVNNGEKVFKETVNIVTSKKLKAIPNSFNVEIGSRDFVVKQVYFDGFGEAIVKAGKSEEKINIFSGTYIVKGKDYLENAYWKVTKDEANVKKIGDFGIWFQLSVGRRELEFTLKGDFFECKKDKFLAEMYPIFDGDILRLKITIKSLGDLEELLRFNIWLDRPPTTSYLMIPISIDTIVKEKMVYPAFPKGFCHVRENIKLGFIGYKISEKVFIVDFGKEWKVSLADSGGGLRLYLPIKLKAGEIIEKEIVLKVQDIREIEKAFKIVRAVSTNFIDGKILVKNNWITDLNVSISIQNKQIEKVFKTGETLEIPIETKGYKEVDMDLEINKFKERRKILITSPQDVEWIQGGANYKNLEIQTSEINGSLKSIKINGEELLYWKEAPERFPHWIPITHGGISLRAFVDNESKEVDLKKWEREGENRYKIKIDDIELTRSWYILDENTIMEEIKAKNLSHRVKTLKFYHQTLFNEPFEEIESKIVKIGHEKVFSIMEKEEVGAKIKKFKISLRTKEDENQYLTAMQLINSIGSFLLKWNWTIKPREEKKKEIYIRIEKI